MVLIVSQETEFYLLFSHILQAEGFDTELIHKPVDTHATAETKRPMAIVLDCQLNSELAPMISGLKNDTPTSQISVIGLLAADAQAQHIDLLKAGADEIFQRPFPPAQLVALLHNKRPAKSKKPASSKGLLAYRDVELNLDTHRVYAAGREVKLPPIEYKLLLHFMLSPGKVFGREDLIVAAWPRKAIADERSVDVHIGRLRKALKRAIGYDMIRTVRTAGYALAEPDIS
ncbi:winged-helix domain-containing protein [Aminobacter aganoensis]|uniref:Two-component system phosphate regulon response regulator PhoB n=1 Tax=Aminobacter aganoensis TaxID=83264 RepID=A0A7X0KNE2_9HYPH|nr:MULTISPECIES: response regulator transcription factor [Aminobacter]MBB6357087.1 two-component system phosphate regulon response regulator PhoB [Aminobacter aganoensis]